MESSLLYQELFQLSPLPLVEVTVSDPLTDYINSVYNEFHHQDVVCYQQEEGEQKMHEERCASTNSIVPSACGKKKVTCGKKKVTKLKNEQLDLQCGWQNCDYHTRNLDHFVHHVSWHIPDLGVKIYDTRKGVYVCLWEQCGFECADSEEIKRHVNYHSYHTKIKCIGSKILARSGLPVCKLHDTRKNVVPNLPHAFECCWQTCEQTFSNPQAYFNHVEKHVYCNPRGRKVKGGVPCHWCGCMSKSMFPSIYKLADHIRSHTQEKLVGCPTCGGLFASRTKFSYHCMHQVPSELRGPSEEVVQKHRRKGVNWHRCPFCDKTCPCPSSLSTHIRYRHLDSKPFTCSCCEYRTKTQHDLKCHLKKHCHDPLYQCKEEGCDFSCRSSYGLRRHCNKCHIGCDNPQYCCHICGSLFLRGSLLTRHLYTQHGICRPSGQYRLRYIREEDGFFRLLTMDTEESNMALEASQPLCGYDEPQKQDAGGGNLIITN